MYVHRCVHAQMHPHNALTLIQDMRYDKKPMQRPRSYLKIKIGTEK